MNFHVGCRIIGKNADLSFGISSPRAFWLGGNKKLNPSFNEGVNEMSG